MFNKMQQLKQAKEMQDKMKEIEVEVEEQGVTMTLNGNFHLESISLNDNLSLEQQEEAIKACHSKAIKQLQQTMAQELGPMMGS